MSSTTKTRTVRLTTEELSDIENFLKKNQFLDFSTLTRLAVAQFIRNPILPVSPLEPKKFKTKVVRQRIAHV